MEVQRMKSTRLIIGVLSIVLVIQVIAAYSSRNAAQPLARPGHANSQVTIVEGTWEDYPSALAEARGKAAGIVVARVAQVIQAPDIVIPDERLPGGEHREPNQRIVFDVLKPIRGNIESPFKLWHYGSDTMMLHDDPHYQVGETYVLFVKPVEFEAGTYAIIGPPSRFRAVANKLELMPGVYGNVLFATALRGKPIAALEQAVASDEAAGR